jgi:ferric-dicitrate binding protein FerR (iron transport regulator)
MYMNNSELQFVLHHYQENTFDPEVVLSNLIHGKHVEPLPTSQRWLAVAASLLCLVALAMLVQWQFSGTPSTVVTPDVQTGLSTPAAPPPSLHFDNTPLPQVLSQLGQHYGVVLSASDSSKCLTGDFTADSLHLTISMIEEVLGVRITIEKAKQP